MSRQMKCTCNANDSTYIQYGFFNQNEIDLWSCLMVLRTLFKDFIFLLGKKYI